jgi:3,4-dihydroxy 2-butanone 4-phosphate synthase/GTP cyclohydrolase II
MGKANENERESTAPAAAIRPSVTLTWAQSLDGSIALKSNERYRLSGEKSMAMTHRLRASHDAILVGINTVLADDPKLNAWRVGGPDPRPVVLDASLRLPPDSYLAARAAVRPWVFHTVAADGAAARRRERLEALGLRHIAVGRGPDGRLALTEVLAALAAEGIGSLMVEGGGAVLAAFLRARLVDRIVVTIAPALLGGYNPFADSAGGPAFRLAGVKSERLGDDIVLEGRPVWEET